MLDYYPWQLPLLIGEIDQSSQVVAMAESIGTTFVPLPLIYCVNPVPTSGAMSLSGCIRRSAGTIRVLASAPNRAPRGDRSPCMMQSTSSQTITW